MKNKLNILLYKLIDFSSFCSIEFIAGVMQATSMGKKIEKRYSPSFHDDLNRKPSASKRKRDDVLRLVLFKAFIYLSIIII